MLYDKPISNFPCAIWLKEIRDDEFEQTNSAIPQLVSLVRTLAGAEIQEANASVRTEIEVTASGGSSTAFIHEDTQRGLHEVPGSKVIEPQAPSLLRRQAGG